MSRELRCIEVWFTVEKADHLPKFDGQPMDADDVAQELRDLLQRAVRSWYSDRGRDLLAGEPML